MSPPLLSFPRARKRAPLAPSQITQSISSEREGGRDGGEGEGERGRNKKESVETERKGKKEQQEGGWRTAKEGGEKDLRRIEAGKTVQDE